MFYRFIGKMFFLFWICPALRHYAGIAVTSACKHLIEECDKMQKKMDMEAQFEKNNTPEYYRNLRRSQH